MVDCEMCGKKNISANKVKIEGTIMTVCDACSKYGVKLADPKKMNNNFNSIRPKFKREDPNANKFIVKNYGPIIKQARESRKLKQEEVASKVGEKESLIHKVESGNFKPSFKLAHKLERFFSIKLIEEFKSTPNANMSSEIHEEGSNLTMENLLLQAMKKAKKK